MNVASLIAKIAGRQKERQQQQVQSYRDLVKQIASGKEPDPGGIFTGPSIVGSGIPAWNFVRKLHIGRDLRSSAMP